MTVQYNFYDDDDDDDDDDVVMWRPVFWDTDSQVVTVAMETTQLVLSQLKNF